MNLFSVSFVSVRPCERAAFSLFVCVSRRRRRLFLPPATICSPSLPLLLPPSFAFPLPSPLHACGKLPFLMNAPGREGRRGGAGCKRKSGKRRKRGKTFKPSPPVLLNSEGRIRPRSISLANFNSCGLRCAVG